MITIKRLFHFLGGIQFAIALIITAALTVIAGTFLESKTGSHLLAARWSYEHPFFQLLLSFFFINILFSALRRWPFKKKHIPFLITHIGLLMIISGTILKNRFGLQGQLSIWEGSGSQQVLLPHTHAIYLEEKKAALPQNPTNLIVLDSFQPRLYFPFHFPELKCKIIGYAPHVKEKPEAWIKEGKAFLSGIPPIPVVEWETSSPFPEGSMHLKAMGSSLQPWKIFALRTEDISEAYRQAYLEGLTLRLTAINWQKGPLEIPLKEALANPFAYANGVFSAALHLTSEEPALLELHWRSSKSNDQEKFQVFLQGSDALLVQSDPSTLLNARFTADLCRPFSTLCLAEATDGKIALLAFDRYGRIYEERFDPSNIKTMVSYDQGFGGYGIQAVIPFPSFPAGREEKEKAASFEFAEQLKLAIAGRPPLSPPLDFLQQACQTAQVDFVEAFIQFLSEWKAAAGINFSSARALPPVLELVFKHLDWSQAEKKDQQAVLWTCRLLEQIEPEMREGKTLHSILEKNHWPFAPAFKDVKASKEPSPLNILAEQLFSLIPHLPPLEFPTNLSNNQQASLLAAFFRVYGIDPQLLLPAQKGANEPFDSLEKYWKTQKDSPHADSELALTFETPLIHRIIPDTPPLKLEERRPGIVMEVQQGREKQSVALAYDPQGIGMKWPVLNGRFLARLQPVTKELPYRLRLRQARQIFYPQSTQVYSYECDVLVSEKGNEATPHTLSMNHVYETWDGYRFYLSGVGTSADSSMKRIQLAVNHDPAKYILTYPGVVLVFTGIVLLFWILPYSKKKK